MDYSDRRIRFWVVCLVLGSFCSVAVIVILVGTLGKLLALEDVREIFGIWFCYFGPIVGMVLGYYFTKFGKHSDENG